MKRLLGLILLAGLLYSGYVYYGQIRAGKVANSISLDASKSVVITSSTDKLTAVANVLGARISSTYVNGKELLNNATNGASEPIINELVNKTTETLKDLPRKEAEKIKYEFCKGVVTEYENKSTNN